MEARTLSVPSPGHLQAVDRVPEEPVELGGDDRLSVPSLERGHEFAADGSIGKWGAGADARVDQDVDQVETAQGAVGSYGRLLGLQTNSVDLLGAADSEVCECFHGSSSSASQGLRIRYRACCRLAVAIFLPLSCGAPAARRY